MAGIIFGELNIIRNEWVSGNNFETRIKNLRTGVGRLKEESLRANFNVLHDSDSVDVLTGGNSELFDYGWFFRDDRDVVTDIQFFEVFDRLR